jgi:hypothetical protein
MWHDDDQGTFVILDSVKNINRLGSVLVYRFNNESDIGSAWNVMRKQ